jgi:hypothetical protein
MDGSPDNTSLLKEWLEEMLKSEQYSPPVPKKLWPPFVWVITSHGLRMIKSPEQFLSIIDALLSDLDELRDS